MTIPRGMIESSSRISTLGSLHLVSTKFKEAGIIHTLKDCAGLFAECYLYRLLRSFFARSVFWKHYDPFSTQKVRAFRSSAAAIDQLSTAVEELIKKAESAAKNRSKASLDGLQAIFTELVQTSLWGNATDLSLLTHLTHADIQQLQAAGVGAESQANRQRFILSGIKGIDSAWKTIVQAASSADSRIDIILDNSGFELFTDLLLADFLLASGLVSKICFHPKDMPWFVSDVTPSDFHFTIEALQSGTFFEESAKEEHQTTSSGTSYESSQLDRSYFVDARNRSASPSASFVVDSSSVFALETSEVDKSSSIPATATQRMACRWAHHLESGSFELSIPRSIPLGGLPSLHRSSQADFWTSYHNYPSIPLAAPTLYKSLQESTLILSKGDLNYRKWCSDARWSFSEPFENVLGPLKGSLNLLVLRTNKADVCVGVPKDRLATLEGEDKNWRTNGKYAMIEFVSKQQ